MHSTLEHSVCEKGAGGGAEVVLLYITDRTETLNDSRGDGKKEPSVRILLHIQRERRGKTEREVHLRVSFLENIHIKTLERARAVGL